MTKRIALCLFGILLCAVLAFGVLALPARADDDTPADGRINEDFENITDIPRAAPWVLPTTSSYTFFLPIAPEAGYNVGEKTGIVEDPAANEDDEAKNHVLRLGQGAAGTSGCMDVFATRHVDAFKTLTVSFDFYFEDVMKSGDYFAQMFFGVNGATDFGSGSPSMPYQILAENGKNVLKSTGAFSFSSVELPLNQWFTVTLSIDEESKTADLYWSTVNAETGELEYNIVVYNANLNATWTAGIQNGLGYMRFGSIAMSYDVNNPVTYYLDNLIVKPELSPISDKMTYGQIFKTLNDYILSKEIDDLIATDIPFINSALADYEKLSDEVKEELYDEYDLLFNMQKQAIARFSTASEDFQSYDAGENMAYTNSTLSATSDLGFAIRSADTNNGTGIVADPLDDSGENKVFRVSGSEYGESADPSAPGKIISRTPAYTYNEIVLIKISYYIPDLLKGSDKFGLYIYPASATSASTTSGGQYFYYIQQSAGKNMITKGKYGTEGSSFFSTELPTDTWFDVIMEVDYSAPMLGTAGGKGRVGIYLKVGDEVTTVGLFDVNSAYKYGIGSLVLLPTLSASGSEDESPSYYYVDNLYQASAGWYDSRELATAREKAKEDARNYWNELSEYIGELDEETEAEWNAVIDDLENATSYTDIKTKMVQFECNCVNPKMATYLESYIEQKLAESEYSDDGIAAINAAKDACLELITQTNIANRYDSATTLGLVLAACENTFAVMDNVANAKQEFDNAVSDAKDTLNAYLTEDYRYSEVQEIIDAANAGLSAVEDAESIEEVRSALEEALAALNEIETRLDVAAAKEDAKAELDEYKDTDDYRDAEQKQLADAIEAGKAAIDEATTKVEVADALNSAKSAIDAIKTDEQYKQEEAAEAALNAVKTAAKAELAAYKNAADYRDEQKAELAAEIEAGNAAIDAAATEKAVSTALAVAKAKIDLIKTSAELDGEQSSGGSDTTVTPPDKKGGCGSDLSSDYALWLAFALLALCAGGITLTAKKQK